MGEGRGGGEVRYSVRGKEGLEVAKLQIETEMNA